jgi:hypothetical protein
VYLCPLNEGVFTELPYGRFTDLEPIWNAEMKSIAEQIEFE